MAAAPATEPTSQPGDVSPRRLKDGQVVVDAANGGDVALDVKKGDVYTFSATGTWSKEGAKPFGPEGRIEGSYGVGDSGSRPQATFTVDTLTAQFTAGEEKARPVPIGKRTRWKADADGVLRFAGLKGKQASGAIKITFHRTAQATK